MPPPPEASLFRSTYIYLGETVSPGPDFVESHDAPELEDVGDADDFKQPWRAQKRRRKSRKYNNRTLLTTICIRVYLQAVLSLHALLPLASSILQKKITIFYNFFLKTRRRYSLRPACEK